MAIALLILALVTRLLYRKANSMAIQRSQTIKMVMANDIVFAVYSKTDKSADPDGGVMNDIRKVSRAKESVNERARTR